MASEYNQLTPQLMELGRMKIILWDGQGGFAYQEKDEELVEAAKQIPPPLWWNQRMKQIRQAKKAEGKKARHEAMLAHKGQ